MTNSRLMCVAAGLVAAIWSAASQGGGVSERGSNGICDLRSLQSAEDALNACIGTGQFRRETSTRIAGVTGAPRSPQFGSRPKHRLICAQHDKALVCHKFVDERSVRQVWSNGGVDCVPDAVYDEGEHAIRLELGSRCGPNSAGTFRFDFPRQTGQLWLQYRIKIDQGLLEQGRAFDLPAPKIFVLWDGAASCTEHEFAHSDSYWRGFPQFYESCGATSLTEQLPPWDGDLQPGGETRCHYQAPAERDDARCLFFREEWATYTFYFDFDGANHGGVAWVDAWTHYDDEDRAVHMLSKDLARIRMAEHIYFGPYMTNKSNQIEHPEWSFWYQDILITTEPLVP